MLFITSFTVPTFQLRETPFLMKSQSIADRSIIDQNEVKIIQTFLYGDPTCSVKDKKLILDASIKYLMETKNVTDEYSM